MRSTKFKISFTSFSRLKFFVLHIIRRQSENIEFKNWRS